MTENGKIFIIKNTILELLSKEQISIGLALYILKDIEKELELTYNEIVLKELKENKQQLQKKQNQKQDNIKEDIYPTEWNFKQETIQDQAD